MSIHNVLKDSYYVRQNSINPRYKSPWSSCKQKKTCLFFFSNRNKRFLIEMEKKANKTRLNQMTGLMDANYKNKAEVILLSLRKHLKGKRTVKASHS